MEQNPPLEVTSCSVSEAVTCPAFYEIWRCIIMFTRACHRTLSWTKL